MLFLAVTPRIIAYSNYLKLRQGENFKINCTASGYPAPSVVWRKPDYTIASALKTTTTGTNTTSIFQLRNVSITNFERMLKILYIFCFPFINSIYTLPQFE